MEVATSENIQLGPGEVRHTHPALIGCLDRRAERFFRRYGDACLIQKKAEKQTRTRTGELTQLNAIVELREWTGMLAMRYGGIGLHLNEDSWRGRYSVTQKYGIDLPKLLFRVLKIKKTPSVGCPGGIESTKHRSNHCLGSSSQATSICLSPFFLFRQFRRTARSPLGSLL
jgi:hypothetical protein